MTTAHPETEALWTEEFETLKSAALSPGVVSQQVLAGHDGIDLLGKMMRGQLPPPPIAHSLNFLLVEVEKGRVVFQGMPLRAFYNPLGSIHGGWIATLLDSCVGCAVHSTLTAGKGYTTVELKVNYVRAVTDTTGPVRAEGKIIALGGRIATAEGRLIDAKGRLLAHATTTCLLFDLTGGGDR